VGREGGERKEKKDLGRLRRETVRRICKEWDWKVIPDHKRGEEKKERKKKRGRNGEQCRREKEMEEEEKRKGKRKEER
ncbi:hypothetical protein, partial [Clostridioides difficile]|uniref:hypothetical protein n=1 Tax=Clostridioides difficile TaxID=1496 RepID=UPI001A9A684E